MLVPSMTVPEIRKELDLDIDEITQRAKNYIPKFRRKIIKEKKKRIRTSVYKKFKSSRKTNWLVNFFNNPEKLNRYSYMLGAYYYSNKGGYRYIQLLSGMKTMYIFNGHFFRRYNDRMNLNLTHPLEITKFFLEENTCLSNLDEKKEIDTDVYSIIRHCIDGLQLGTYLKKQDTYILNTFLSENEFRKEQLLIQEKGFNTLICQRLDNPLRQFKEDKSDFGKLVKRSLLD